ncbi:MAG: hypothetical protein J4F38_14640 [Pseudomonadales bacterium]|nr:hypothetical protein [Pseudomonadales bacterium]
MADPLFEEAYEYLAEDGSVSDECLPGRAAFRPKGLDQKAGFWMVPISEPNETTIRAMEELEDGRGKRFESTDALFEDLGI